MELAEILSRFRGPLVGLIISWGATPSESDEIAQDSFADAYMNRHACRGNWEDPEAFGRWLRGIAKNKFRNEMRSQRRRSKRIILVESSVLDSSASPVGEVESDYLVRLREAIDALPKDLKQVVIMHYLEITSVCDVAALLSLPAKTVEGRLYRARRRLKELLGDKPRLGIGKALVTASTGTIREKGTNDAN